MGDSSNEKTERKVKQLFIVCFWEYYNLSDSWFMIFRTQLNFEKTMNWSSQINLMRFNDSLNIFRGLISSRNHSAWNCLVKKVDQDLIKNWKCKLCQRIRKEQINMATNNNLVKNSSSRIYSPIKITATARESQ